MGVLKPQPEHTPEELALVRRYPSGAAATDPALAAPYGTYALPHPRAPVLPDPPGAQARRRAAPAVQRGRRNSYPRALLAWLAAQDGPVTYTDAVAEVLGGQAGVTLPRLARKGLVETRSYRKPACAVPVVEWQLAGRPWPALPPGAVPYVKPPRAASAASAARPLPAAERDAKARARRAQALAAGGTP
jgi:hypothetical protein